MLRSIFSTPHSILPSPQEVLSQLSLNSQERDVIDQNRSKIASLLNGDQEGFLIIMGPCSIHDRSSALEYAKKLKILQEKVGTRFFLVMRVFLEKPRTTLGWKGLLMEPEPGSAEDPIRGLFESRQLLLELVKVGIPIGTEFLNPSIALYLEDCISWGCIGARTASSPIHRELASLLPIPIGFKNSIEGNLHIPVQGLFTARHPQTALAPNKEGILSSFSTPGNPHTHLILRGGPLGPNYSKESCDLAESILETLDIRTKILIDCAHDNSSRDLEKQKKIFNEILDRREGGEERLGGILLESFLKEGKQPFPPTFSDQSITDPCLGWETSETLILSRLPL